MGANEEHPDLLALDAVRAGEAGADDHVESCAECRAALDDLRALEDGLKAPAVAIPEAVDQAVLAAAARGPRPRKLRFWMPISMAAALFLSILTVLVIWAPGTAHRGDSFIGSPRMSRWKGMGSGS